MNSEGQTLTERRLAAILTADVVGYSRLMGRDEEGTHAAFKAIRRDLSDPIIQEHRGRIVKTTGDGLLVEFASVVDAVRCAVVLQREMAKRSAGVPAERRIEFRIGINLGDIIIDEDDIFGDGVNVAARLEPLADPGGICISQAVRDQVRDKLDLAFEDMGVQRVKNIARPLRVYRIPIAERAETQVAAEKSDKGPLAYDFYGRLRRRFNVRSLAVVICAAVSASVLPTSTESLFQFGNRTYPEPAPQSDGRGGASMRMAAATDQPPASHSTMADQTARSSPIGEPVFFERGKVVISPAALLTIDKQAAYLRENPKMTVTIEGHCSEDEGAREGSSVLAQLRANQVRNALKERGVADGRIQMINYGKAKPAAVGDSEATQALNRRAVVVLN